MLEHFDPVASALDGLIEVGAFTPTAVKQQVRVNRGYEGGVNETGVLELDVSLVGLVQSKEGRHAVLPTPLRNRMHESLLRCLHATQAPLLVASTLGRLARLCTLGLFGGLRRVAPVAIEHADRVGPLPEDSTDSCGHVKDGSFADSMHAHLARTGLAATMQPPSELYGHSLAQERLRVLAKYIFPPQLRLTILSVAPSVPMFVRHHPKLQCVSCYQGRNLSGHRGRGLRTVT